ncbi:MAG: glycine zipper domain-containing protein [Planctomycetota bacterium]
MQLLSHTGGHVMSLRFTPKFRRTPIGAFLASLAFLGSPSHVMAQQNTQRGATLGGITGAIAGAIIGDNNDEAGAGAAIGGALGAVAGGLLGNAQDKEIRSYPAYPSQSIPSRTVYTAPPSSGAVSMSDIVTMSRSGVSETVILNQIQTRGVVTQPQVSDIIALHQQGVSESVITAMQRAPVGNSVVVAPPTTYVAPAPIVVQPRVYAHPGFHHPGPVYRARPTYRFHYGF